LQSEIHVHIDKVMRQKLINVFELWIARRSACMRS
jgi:hypothetical protein